MAPGAELEAEERGSFSATEANILAFACDETSAIRQGNMLFWPRGLDVAAFEPEDSSSSRDGNEEVLSSNIAGGKAGGGAIEVSCSSVASSWADDECDTYGRSMSREALQRGDVKEVTRHPTRHTSNEARTLSSCELLRRGYGTISP